VRGLKFCFALLMCERLLSHPPWVRGLKYLVFETLMHFDEVAPPVGAWIEIVKVLEAIEAMGVAPPVGAWIEIL